MTTLAWANVADLEPGDQLASIVGYATTRHPKLSTIERQAGGHRATVLSKEGTTLGGTRIVLQVGTSRLTRTWNRDTIVAIDTKEATP